jgi:hypothetical protein
MVGLGEARNQTERFVVERPDPSSGMGRIGPLGHLQCVFSTLDKERCDAGSFGRLGERRTHGPGRID